MSEVAIRVEDLGKKYIIGHQKAGDFRSAFSDRLKYIFSAHGRSKEEFWALRDINFEVKQGEAVGIIGRNGAGKSTLLKILSRITDPTTGRFEINGRVSSLLEVGTGFHMELTGRENIFLNGTILGMKRREIKAKFDQIVDFSGVEKFLDTPVKHYSSGMTVRLAFSVAAHLEPEILIVDEVLAVGDAEFQKKCLGKMDEVSKKEGRTVLFVSHNMAAVSGLCSNAMLLVDGQISSIGVAENVIGKYLSIVELISQTELISRIDRRGSGKLLLSKIELLNEYGEKVNSIFSGQTIVFRFHMKNRMKITNGSLRIDVGMNNRLNNRIAWFSSELTPGFSFKVNDAESYLDLRIEKFPFNQGIYTLTPFIEVNGEVADWINDAISFYVEAGDFYGTGKTVIERQGPFLVKHAFISK